MGKGEGGAEDLAGCEVWLGLRVGRGDRGGLGDRAGGGSGCPEPGARGANSGAFRGVGAAPATEVRTASHAAALVREASNETPNRPRDNGLQRLKMVTALRCRSSSLTHARSHQASRLAAVALLRPGGASRSEAPIFCWVTGARCTASACGGLDTGQHRRRHGTAVSSPVCALSQHRAGLRQRNGESHRIRTRHGAALTGMRTGTDCRPARSPPNAGWLPEVGATSSPILIHVPHGTRSRGTPPSPHHGHLRRGMPRSPHLGPRAPGSGPLAPPPARSPSPPRSPRATRSCSQPTAFSC